MLLSSPSQLVCWSLLRTQRICIIPNKIGQKSGESARLTGSSIRLTQLLFQPWLEGGRGGRCRCCRRPQARWKAFHRTHTPPQCVSPINTHTTQDRFTIFCRGSKTSKVVFFFVFFTPSSIFGKRVLGVSFEIIKPYFCFKFAVSLRGARRRRRRHACFCSCRRGCCYLLAAVGSINTWGWAMR